MNPLLTLFIETVPSTSRLVSSKWNFRKRSSI